MATGIEKYACRIPEELDRVVNRVSTTKNIGRNESLKHMVQLALDNSDHPAQKFSGNNAVSANLQTDKGFFESTMAYRNKHGIPNKKSRFLRDALERGAAVFNEPAKT